MHNATCFQWSNLFLSGNFFIFKNLLFLEIVCMQRIRVFIAILGCKKFYFWKCFSIFRRYYKKKWHACYIWNQVMYFKMVLFFCNQNLPSSLVDSQNLPSSPIEIHQNLWIKFVSINRISRVIESPQSTHRILVEICHASWFQTIINVINHRLIIFNFCTVCPSPIAIY